MPLKQIQRASFSNDDVDVISRDSVYQGFFKMEKVQLRHRLFKGGWSDSFCREVFIRGQAVAAVMYDPQHRLVGLVEQFRVGALTGDNDLAGSQQSPWLYEVVAGMTEADESPRDVILRELAEEAGMVPEALLPICEYFTSPGGSDETLALFCALGDLSELSGIHGLPDEHEDIQVIVLPEQTVFEQLYSGRFNNAATLICLQWLLMNRESMSRLAKAEA